MHLDGLDLRLAILLIWGGGIILVWGGVLRRAMLSHRLHHDARSRRELISTFALFLTAVCAGAAVAFVLFGQAGTGVRAFATSISLGAFLGAGIVLLSARPSREDV